ncbi:SdpI family protein [Candidatus Micrarchaeota archaeon]|nr:SdpI family protein [Candidatus Micrarchaeota archaeon]
MQKHDILPLILILASFFLAFAYYDSVPDDMAIHFDASGHPEEFVHKSVGLVLVPVIGIIVFLLLRFLPLFATDTDRKQLLHMSRIIYGLAMFILFFFLFVQVFIIASNTGYRVSVSLFSIPLAILFGYLGWVMPKLERNYFIGLRFPWTLADNENWVLTHRFSRYLFLSASLFILSSLYFTTYGIWLIIVPIILTLFVSAAYSYKLYRKTHSGIVKTKSRSARKKR